MNTSLQIFDKERICYFKEVHMRKIFLFMLPLMFLIVLPGLAVSGDITPVPKATEYKGKEFRLKEGIRIDAEEACLPVASYLVDELSRRTGLQLKLSAGGEIMIRTLPENEVGGIEGYDISTGSSRIIVSGGSKAGALYGIRTLLMTLEKDAEGYYFKGASIKDHPDIAMRVLHLALIPDIEYLKETISKAADYKFNTLILMVDSKVIYKSHPELARPGSITMETLTGVVAYAKKLGFEVIPHLELCTHQEYFLKSAYPSLLINVHTYDPYKNEVYKITADLMDELIEVFKPKYFHIGHDEVYGVHWATKEAAEKHNTRLLTVEGFARDINLHQAYLKKKGIQTIVWGDMFLNPSMFPNMAKNQLHGTDNFDKSLDMISKDVIIADYHYYDTKDFSTMKYFQEKGFKVFGSTWDKKKNISSFSRYVSGNRPSTLGMIATTWYWFTRPEKKNIEDIIEWSGEAYWNASKELQ
jgi:N-acetyl-beta-hexosaminidase